MELVDVEQAMGLSELSPGAIPGRDLFYEHVHMKFAGNYEVAKALLPVIARAIDPKTPASAPPSLGECASLLGLSKWRLGEMLVKIVALTSGPPFTGQIDHAQRQLAADKELKALQASLGAGDIQQALARCRKAISHAPKDWLLHYDIAALYDRARRWESSIYHLKTVLRMMPRHHLARLGLAHGLAHKGRDDEALAEYRKVLAAGVTEPSAYVGIGVVLARGGKYDEAIENFKEALRIKPDDKEAATNLEAAERLKSQGQ